MLDPNQIALGKKGPDPFFFSRQYIAFSRLFTLKFAGPILPVSTVVVP